jgi:hypothetical protein
MTYSSPTECHPVKVQDLKKEFSHALKRGEYYLRLDYVNFIDAFTTQMDIPLTVDAFASLELSVLKKFWTMHDNAFSHSWTDEVLYLHPPYTVLDKVVEKIFDDQCIGVLVCPVETSSQWFYRLQFISFYWIDLIPDESHIHMPDGCPFPVIKDVLFRIVFFCAYDANSSFPDEYLDYSLPSFQIRGTIDASKPIDSSIPFIDKLRDEFQDVLTNPESATTFSSEIRGPFGLAHIELKPDARPVRKKFFRCSQEREEAMLAFIKKLTSRGWIVPSHSEWAAQAFLVPKPADPTKKEKQWRLVVDYRYLNTQTKDDPFPLPLIEDLVYKQARNSIWTIFDLEDGFHQMHLAPASQELTAFVTSQGLFHWTVLPMGVKNGPAMFQRMISWILRDLPQAVVYIDDVLVGTSESPNLKISAIETDSYTLLPDVKAFYLHKFGISTDDIQVELFASKTNATHKHYLTQENSAFGRSYRRSLVGFGPTHHFTYFHLF